MITAALVAFVGLVTPVFARIFTDQILPGHNMHWLEMLLFDEATSALDNITQKHVSDSLKNLKSTRIVIAHRLSTIKECDRIIVLDKGRIVEDGTYQSLSKAGGFFSELVERQKN